MIQKSRVRLVAATAALPLAAVVILAGPRARVDSSYEPPDVPHGEVELAGHVAAGESVFDDLVPGTEKRIIWADPERPARTELAVVQLHGFSATHRETAPLTEELARGLGANAFLTRLSGHGRSPEALGRTRAREWLQDAAEAVEIGSRLGERVILLGVSTGATLATWAAAQPEWRDDIAALLMISPNYALNDSRAWMLTAPWGGRLARLVQGDEYGFEPSNELHRRYWTERYPVEVLTELGALIELIDEELLASIGAPTLIFLSPNDRIIDPEAVRDAMGPLGASHKELVSVTEVEDASNHVLAGDILSPGTTASVAARMRLFVETRVR